MPDIEKMASQTRKTTKDDVRTNGKQKEEERRVQDALEDDEVRINLERMHKRSGKLATACDGTIR